MPVVLIGDIDRGGVIASLAGTKAVIAPEDAAHIVGFIVNKFRGDPTLFADGMRAIEQATGWPGLGLVPFFKDAGRLPAEDALALDGRKQGVTGGKPLDRRARLSAHLEFRRLRSARPRARRGADLPPARRADPAAQRRSSSCRAPRPPSPTSQPCAKPAGTSTSRPTVAAAAMCSASAAAIRCSVSRIADPQGIEGAAECRRRPGACSTSRLS